MEFTSTDHVAGSSMMIYGGSNWSAQSFKNVGFSSRPANDENLKQVNPTGIELHEYLLAGAWNSVRSYRIRHET